MSFPVKLKGYTLILAIAVIMIIATVAMLCLSYFRINSETLHTATIKAKAAFYSYEALKACNNEGIYDEERHYQFDDGFLINTQKRKWGAFDMLYATVTLRNGDTQMQKIALVGNCRSSGDYVSLYLRSSNSMVTLGDTVRITGLCFFPMHTYSTFLKTDLTTIDKKQILTSRDSLPEPSNWLQCIEWIRTFKNIHSNTIHISDTVKVDFKSPTTYIDADTVTISGKLQGNIIVHGDRIVVEKNAIIIGTIFIGNSIVFPDHFTGQLQAFANDSICIGQHCSFRYPSILALIPGVKEEKKGSVSYHYISAKDSLYVEGEIVAISPLSQYRSRLSVNIQGQSRIIGSIYTHGTLSWKGLCKGSIIADKIAGVDKRTVKINYITNMNIDSVGNYFSHSTLFPYNGASRIAAWLK